MFTAHAVQVVYEYDEAGRLKKVVYPNASQRKYALDPSGNRLTVDTVEAPPSFSIVGQSFDETVGSASIVVVKNGVTQATLTVSYATANGSAVAGSDYTAASGTLSFAAGETSKTFPVTITNDSLFESNETFSVTLSSPSGGAALLNATASMTIVQPPDRVPPSVPTGLTGSVVSARQINLSWNASTDAGAGLAGYRVLRDGAQIATSTSNSYTDSTVQPTLTYSYAIQAFDAANPPNVSAASTSATFTTPSLVPATPRNFGLDGLNSTGVTLRWDPVANATNYQVLDVGTGLVYFGTATTTRVGSQGQIYSFFVQACNADGCSAPSFTITVQIPCQSGLTCEIN